MSRSQHNAILLFARTPHIARGNPSEPYATLPWEDLDALFTALLGDVIEGASRVTNSDILLYRNPAELSDDFLRPFHDRLHCHDLLLGSFSHNVQQATENAFAQLYNRVVILLDNHPILHTRYLSRIIHQLSYEDDCVVMGPTVDGKCFVVGMKSNHSAIFQQTEPDPIRKPYTVLKRLCGLDVMLFPTPPAYLLDSGFNLARLKQELDSRDSAASDFPHRTYEMFKMFDKKYRLKKPVR